MSNRDGDVILACLKLARAMRRIPPERREYPFPPAVGRLLDCAAKNPGVSSRELCEFLDVRPSSLSEMLSRAEKEGWIIRTVDEADRRIQRVDLSPKGKAFIAEMEAAREKDAVLLLGDNTNNTHPGAGRPAADCCGAAAGLSGMGGRRGFIRFIPE